MAKIKQIYVSHSYTKNIGNYESSKVEHGCLIELEEGEKESEVRQKAKDYMSAEVERSIAEMTKRMRK